MLLSSITLALRQQFVGLAAYGPALSLEFTSPTQTLDPRVTFTRTSNATVTDSTGTLVYAPHNLLTFSESFDNAVWSKQSATVAANTTVAPDGTTTADKLVENTAATVTRWTQLSVTSADAVHTFSFYAKAAERSLIMGQISGSTNYTIGFNLQTGTVVNTLIGGTTQATSASITLVGDGWYRCTLTQNANAGTSVGGRVWLTNGSTALYTGDGTSGVFLWGAQLNVGSLQPYYPTTRKNLLGFTQEFDNAGWVKSTATVSANVAVDPQGFMTADKLVEAAGSVNPFAAQSPAFVAGTPYTFTCYAKEDPTSAKRYLMLLLPSGAFGSNIRGVFDLGDGTFTTTGTATVSMDFVGNGWWRCRVTATASTTVSSGLQVRLSDVGTGSFSSYTGDGTSGIFIWGAQLSDSASLDPYVYNPGAAPASTAYFGPRFDYDPVTLAPKGLLIEEQRTNSIRNSVGVGAVAGTPGTLPTNWSVAVASGLTTNVIGTGISAGVSYIDLQIVGTSNSTSYILAFELNSQIAALQNQNWSESLWISHVAGSFANISATSLNIRQSNSAGSQVAATVVTFSQPTSTLARVSGTATLSEVTTAFVTPGFRLTIANGAAIDITLRIGLPQLELGAFSTSAIPTTTAAATRAADVAVMQGANFSNWYRADEGSFYSEVLFGASAAVQGETSVLNVLQGNSLDNQVRINRQVTSGNFRLRYRANAADVGTPEVASAMPLNKVAAAYANGSQTIAANGTLGGTGSGTGAIPTVNNIVFGRFADNSAATILNGHIRRLAFFPRRLADAELTSITS